MRIFGDLVGFGRFWGWAWRIGTRIKSSPRPSPKERETRYDQCLWVVWCFYWKELFRLFVRIETFHLKCFLVYWRRGRRDTISVCGMFWCFYWEELFRLFVRIETFHLKYFLVFKERDIIRTVFVGCLMFLLERTLSIVRKDRNISLEMLSCILKERETRYEQCLWVVGCFYWKELFRLFVRIDTFHLKCFLVYKGERRYTNSVCGLFDAFIAKNPFDCS